MLVDDMVLVSGEIERTTEFEKDFPIHHARRLTGVEQVHAVIGGFHLTGALFEPIIPVTIEALKKINPRYVVPGHCSGWLATHQIARAMPEAFIQNSVGANFVL